MSTILDTMYRKVIRSRYANACEACGEQQAADAHWAAVDAAKRWHPYCDACASSYAAFVQRAAIAANALAATATNLDTAPAIDSAAMVAIIRGEVTEWATVKPTIAALLALLAHVRNGQPKYVDPRIADLRNVLADVKGRSQSFAQDLLASYERRGSLSDKQWEWVVKLAADAVPTAPAVDPMVAAIDALLANVPTRRYAIPGTVTGTDNDLVFVRVTKTDPRTIAHTVGGQGEMPVGLAWQHKAAQHLAGLTADEQRAAAELYGRELGHCGRCGRELTDLTSRQNGLGPECIRKVW